MTEMFLRQLHADTRRERDEALAEVERLRAALAWYADPASYDDYGAPGEWSTNEGHPGNSGFTEDYYEPDHGHRARVALDRSPASTAPEGSAPEIPETSDG